jgi:nucleotide-binding universal stress UspA family protein
MTVVVGVDGSKGAQAAVRLAALEADYRSVQLVAVTAYSPEHPLGAPAVRPVATVRTAEEERLTAETALHDAVLGALGSETDQVSLRVVPGPPGRALVGAARQAQAQLVVLAARAGATLLPGSVSQYVLRHAPCPVLVVPDGPRAG